MNTTLLSCVKSLPLLALLGALTCCASNEELQKRMDHRNEHYSNFQKRREIRQDARQERTDAWFDRVMH